MNFLKSTQMDYILLISRYNFYLGLEKWMLWYMNMLLFSLNGVLNFIIIVKALVSSTSSVLACDKSGKNGGWILS